MSNKSLESSDSVLEEFNKVLIKNDLFRKTLEKIADDKVSQEDKAILAKNILNDELEKEETELKPCPCDCKQRTEPMNIF